MGGRHLIFATGLAALAVGACASSAQAAAADLYYERTLMSAADARCDLFAPPVSAALAAAQAQARGAALRSGADGPALAQVERRARARAEATPCGSRDLATAAGRVRQAFDGYARLSRITYPGDVAGWSADRTSASKPRWRLAQTTRFGFNTLKFGLAGTDGREALLALANFPDGRAPYAARLVMRDTARAPRPYLLGPAAGPRPPLARRVPPASASRVYQAEARAVADPALAGPAGGWAFRFPAQAAGALATLDPREAVAVEFVFAGRRDEVRRAYVEVGDFAAGQAFVRLAQR